MVLTFQVFVLCNYWTQILCINCQIEKDKDECFLSDAVLLKSDNTVLLPYHCNHCSQFYSLMQKSMKKNNVIQLFSLHCGTIIVADFRLHAGYLRGIKLIVLTQQRQQQQRRPHPAHISAKLMPAKCKLVNRSLQFSTFGSDFLLIVILCFTDLMKQSTGSKSGGSRESSVESQMSLEWPLSNCTGSYAMLCHIIKTD